MAKTLSFAGSRLTRLHHSLKPEACKLETAMGTLKNPFETAMGHAAVVWGM
jgi:hypothetical protein